MGVLWKRVFVIVAAMSVISTIAFLFTVDDDNTLEGPTQKGIDRQTDVLMRYLNDPSPQENGQPILESYDGLFHVAEDSPTIDSARYMFAAALPMEGCQYVNWSASNAISDPSKMMTIKESGDKISGRPYDSAGNEEIDWGMYRIALVDVTAQISCKDKNNLPSVKISYGLMMEMSAWDTFSRIYSVNYH